MRSADVNLDVGQQRFGGPKPALQGELRQNRRAGVRGLVMDGAAGAGCSTTVVLDQDVEVRFIGWSRMRGDGLASSTGVPLTRVPTVKACHLRQAVYFH